MTIIGKRNDKGGHTYLQDWVAEFCELKIAAGNKTNKFFVSTHRERSVEKSLILLQVKIIENESVTKE